MPHKRYTLRYATPRLKKIIQIQIKIKKRPARTPRKHYERSKRYEVPTQCPKRWVPGMSRGFHLWYSQPLDSCALMAGKPAPSSLEPPRQAEGTSELNAKLGEKGLMAVRSLSPNTPNPEAPSHAEHKETYKG